MFGPFWKDETSPDMKSIADIFRSYAVFDADGRHTNGCDKQSNHNYGHAYERLIMDNFEGVGDGPYPERGDVKLMMEVGIADGSSLLAWSEVFPNATCVGMDIHESVRAKGDRIEFHFGDQRIHEDCEAAAAGRQFDLIVEDATHHLENTLLTLFWLWPYVRPGGLYVVEEWEDVRSSEKNIRALWRDNGCGECVHVEIIGTCGPHIQDEPLVVFRKPRT